MRFPERPTVHQGSVSPVFRIAQDDVARWGEPRVHPYEDGTLETFRRCAFCGSMHPEDLLRVLGEGAHLERADMKYGWPHKFYVSNIPNPRAHAIVRVGGDYGPGHPEGGTPIMGRAGNFHAKFYNEHLLDEGFDVEAFGALVTALKSGGVEFDADGKGIRWRLV